MEICEGCKVKSFHLNYHDILCPVYSILYDKHEREQMKAHGKKNASVQKNVKFYRDAEISELNCSAENVITSGTSLSRSEMNATNSGSLRNRIQESTKSRTITSLVRGCLSEESRRKLDAILGFTTTDDCRDLIPDDSRNKFKVYIPLSLLTDSPLVSVNNDQISITDGKEVLGGFEDPNLYLNRSRIIPANLSPNRKESDVCVDIPPSETSRDDCILIPEYSCKQFKDIFENSEEPLDLSIPTASSSASSNKEQISTTKGITEVEDFKEIDWNDNIFQINPENGSPMTILDLIKLYQINLNDFQKNASEQEDEVNRTYTSSDLIYDEDKNAFMNIDSGQECLDLHETVPPGLKSTAIITEPVTEGELSFKNQGSSTRNEAEISVINTTQSTEYLLSASQVDKSAEKSLPKAKRGFNREKEIRNSDSKQEHLMGKFNSVPQEVKNTADIPKSVTKGKKLSRNYGGHSARSEITEVPAAGTSGVEPNETSKYGYFVLIQRADTGADSSTEPYVPNQSSSKFQKQLRFQCLKCKKVYASIEEHQCTFVTSDTQ